MAVAEYHVGFIPALKDGAFSSNLRNDCGDRFTTAVPADAETPDIEPCEACASTEVRTISRAR